MSVSSVVPFQYRVQYCLDKKKSLDKSVSHQRSTGTSVKSAEYEAHVKYVNVHCRVHELQITHDNRLFSYLFTSSFTLVPVVDFTSL